jgi:hypothetical protein
VCGFSIGDIWNKKDLSEVENEFLRRYDDVSWININRRGVVAYVSLMEKETDDGISNGDILYSNIVATHDCVVEEITVKSGTAVVKVGDSVKKGDLLILGANPEGVGGEFCRADGRVVGRVSEKISVNVAREYEKISISSKKIQSINVNIFKISINIFKTYGNLTNGCDIIEDEKEYVLPNGALLPFSVTFAYLPTYETESRLYSDEEIMTVARDRLSLETALLLSTADLIRICSDGAFSDSGYSMWSEIVYLAEIGCENSFDITD